MKLITQQGFVMVDTTNSERMRQHAREFKNEPQAAPHMAPIAPGWAMGRDMDGNATPVPLTRVNQRELPSLWDRVVIVVALVASVSLVVYAGACAVTALVKHQPEILTHIAARLGMAN